jgi:peptidoglycan/xylan/chitin deacetylase (PgdA/CDA1 family)
VIPALRNVLRSTGGLTHRVTRHFRKASPGAVTAFLFHDVTDSPSEFQRAFGLAVPPTLFRSQVNWIRSTFEIVHPLMLLDGSRLPARAALITFDDGSLGAFENGIRWLSGEGIPAAMFLNMRTVLEQRPMLSALVSYLDHHQPRFGTLAESLGLRRPFHLTMTPSVMRTMEEQLGAADLNSVLSYQGAIADIRELRRWEHDANVVLGNHLFDHWNAAALSPDELREQFERNQAELSRLRNHSQLFAFPNGQPGTCWSSRDVGIVRHGGAGRAFAAVGGVNHDERSFVLGRIALGPNENSANRLWYSEARARSQQPLITAQANGA